MWKYILDMGRRLLLLVEARSVTATPSKKYGSERISLFDSGEEKLKVITNCDHRWVFKKIRVQTANAQTDRD